ncbi:cysteine-rich CWC family protein [Pseudomonas lundensis]|uniref:cysteine-rich CWC family protein n=1 Tax=Pseudomonas lundensis TaxID=86185 RepID=UPI000BA293CC|nr:cysteine-rich CWC family protein [Pseudomonas lundensis]NNA18868.1 cysteine-rich CWC family protein [Pseudomonas lundensis]OZY48218.1 helicase [Pseudomonas lundensis]QOF90469.1 cysteine-rich CWC family protein [Pseudomonas lundensis]
MPTPALCPACGASNECAMLASDDVPTSACWCFSVTLDPSVIDALPAELRNAACLCPRCAGVLEQLPATTGDANR